MPRAALRKPHPSLDLTSHLLDPESLPTVINSQTLFGNDHPLEIEVGSGKGLFLQTESALRAESNFLGIEIARKYAAHAAARLAKSARPNAKMIAGDASRLFSDQPTPQQSSTRIADDSLDAIHVYFPDPWWKKRHRKRRVLSETNIRMFSRCLTRGGRMHFWTDVLDYFEATIELVAELAPELGVPLPESPRDASHDTDFHTHFERRSRRMGIPVYRVHYRKRS
ncbi:MAG: tRNA (guanine-N7)-methyltransferase [Planctomycetota bacterium]